jgi:hypothetical protein
VCQAFIAFDFDAHFFLNPKSAWVNIAFVARSIAGPILFAQVRSHESETEVVVSRPAVSWRKPWSMSSVRQPAHIAEFFVLTWTSSLAEVCAGEVEVSLSE